MTPSGNCFAMTATEPADSSRDRRRTGRPATKKTVARPWNRLRNPLRRPRPYGRSGLNTARSVRAVRFHARRRFRLADMVRAPDDRRSPLAERADEAGLHFDAVVNREEEFSVTTMPETAFRRECDLRAPCRAEGVIGEAEALAA